MIDRPIVVHWTSIVLYGCCMCPVDFSKVFNLDRPPRLSDINARSKFACAVGFIDFCKARRINPHVDVATSRVTEVPGLVPVDTDIAIRVVPA